MAGTYGNRPQGQGGRRVAGSAEPMMPPGYSGYGRPPPATSQPPYRTQPVNRRGSLQPITTAPGRYNPTGELVAGVGITFAPNYEGYHVVTAIRPNSAAQMSRRILLGDIIQKVGKKPVQGLPTDHVVALLLGTPGTNVELSVLDGTFQYLPPKLVNLQRTPLGFGAHGYNPYAGRQYPGPQSMQTPNANFSGPARTAIAGPNRTGPTGPGR